MICSGVDDSGRRSMETVFGMSSSSIGSVCCWKLDTLNGTDARCSNFLSRRLAISLAVSDKKRVIGDGP